MRATFFEPNFAGQDNFGFYVAVAGKHVLISAFRNDTGGTNAGSAYLFNTNGTVMTTFTNPAPAASDWFGRSIAGMGEDHVIIGAPSHLAGVGGPGVAYLFRTNGTLLATFADPAPMAGNFFGSAVMGVGRDRVLVGAPDSDVGAADAGVVYLFGTNGMLLTSITNPAPVANDEFGSSLAALGNDRLLIGASRKFTGATPNFCGAAYMFSTNGTLLATFTNPVPADLDRFGASIAVLADGRIAIGDYRHSAGAAASGAAYLFSTNGNLLTTITNPFPGSSDQFGYAVAALGSDGLVVGVPYSNIGATDSGVAHLFRLVPSLDIRTTPTNTLAVSWPLFSPDYLPQQNADGLATGSWSNVTEAVQNDGTNKYIIVDPTTGNRFYRLIKP